MAQLDRELMCGVCVKIQREREIERERDREMTER